MLEVLVVGADGGGGRGARVRAHLPVTAIPVRPIRIVGEPATVRVEETLAITDTDKFKCGNNVK
jgi:hypothetical protein